jgi:hypothetical protein
MDMMVYIGSGLRDDKKATSCVRRSIMICWDETTSTSHFIGYGGRIYMNDLVG